MRLLLSGEGTTDIGASCAGEDGPVFTAGPMTHIIDKVVSQALDFSPLEAQCVDHLPRVALAALAKAMPRKPPMLLPGVKRPAGYAGHFLQAVALGKRAQELAKECGDAVIPVMFRDSDGTNSDEPHRWQNLVASIADGFRAASAALGVPMVPKPKQESWLVCAFKGDAYQNCGSLEQQPGNDASPNSLKRQLDQCFDEPPSHERLTELVIEHFDCDRIDMPSFVVFAESLRKACNDVRGS